MTPPQAPPPPPDMRASGAARRLDVHMSPPAKKQKRHAPVRATLDVKRTPPPESYRPEPELPDCHFYGTSKRRSPRENLRLKSRHPTLGAAAANKMMNAYTDMPKYSINPSSMSSFTKMCQAMVDLIDTGVPSNSEANENSAITKYWKPFCLELGTSWERPNYAGLKAAQRSTEDQMKAMFLLWCHHRMVGRKNKDKVADPNSVMNTLRSVIRVINRHSDGDAHLKKDTNVRKGMRTLYVKEYGPIHPDKACPFPKTVLERLLNFPEGSRLV